ncbi:MAG: 50S ribosomal protein L4, partial [Candidatus Paceibacterota bacterium]
MKAPVYTQAGTKKGEIDLPESVFGVAWNGDLVHQVVLSQQANRRQHLAFVKDRSEVSGGGKKPW